MKTVSKKASTKGSSKASAKKAVAKKTKVGDTFIYTLATNHQPGSRKVRVHATYDAKGKDAAIAHGLRLKLKKTTLRSWCSTWASPKYIKLNEKALAKAKAAKASTKESAKAA